MPDKDDKTKGRTSQPGEYARDDDGSIHEVADGHKKSFKSAQDRDADTSQGDRDEHDRDAASVPFQHGT